MPRLKDRYNEEIRDALVAKSGYSTPMQAPKLLKITVNMGVGDAKTEARILEAALGVFSEQGPDAPVIDDFVRAAGIARGTFDNHFRSVKELLEATSEWTTGAAVRRIQTALAPLDDPALRLGVGVRLFLEQARADRVWCRFVATVWKIGSLDLPGRDLREGIRRRIFRVPSADAALDLLLGAVRQACFRIGTEKISRAYCDEIVQLCLQSLGADGTRIEQTLRYPLPPQGRLLSPRVEARRRDGYPRTGS